MKVGMGPVVSCVGGARAVGTAKGLVVVVVVVGTLVTMAGEGALVAGATGCSSPVSALLRDGATGVGTDGVTMGRVTGGGAIVGCRTGTLVNCGTVGVGAGFGAVGTEIGAPPPDAALRATSILLLTSVSAPAGCWGCGGVDSSVCENVLRDIVYVFAVMRAKVDRENHATTRTTQRR